MHILSKVFIVCGVEEHPAFERFIEYFLKGERRTGYILCQTLL